MRGLSLRSSEGVCLFRHGDGEMGREGDVEQKVWVKQSKIRLERGSKGVSVVFSPLLPKPPAPLLVTSPPPLGSLTLQPEAPPC